MAWVKWREAVVLVVFGNPAADRDADDRPGGRRHASSSTTQSGRRRPRVRLSVRALMIVVLILGGGMGWLVRRAHDPARCRRGRRAGRRAVWYDWEWAGVRSLPDGRIIAGMPPQKGVSPWPGGSSTRSGPTIWAT